MTSRGDKPLGLELDPARPPATPRAAATVIVVREGPGAIEVFCVRRHQSSAFLGGAVVFPGGKVDAADASPAFGAISEELAPRSAEMAESPEEARALAVAAAREMLEEAEIVPADVDAAGAKALREELERTKDLAGALASRDLRLHLGALVPFARWVTPTAEPRRFDARFFLLPAPSGQLGQHDEHETTHSFWATPRDVLARFERGEIQLAPPTTRSLELLVDAKTVSDALAVAAAQDLRPICPRFVPSTPPMLTLPGDPEHDLEGRVVAGPTRFVLRDGRFVSEDPPAR
jgi:8-oxo-dGTP pyrophosphatase MutT (NUDIX family)